MAAATERLRFFTNVYVLPMRNPFLVAKAVGHRRGALGQPGRPRHRHGLVRGGVRPAWSSRSGKRGKRADEMLDVLRELWTGEMVEHHGEFYDFPGSR